MMASVSQVQAAVSNSARCRRKQAKPRRKKVELEEVSDELVIDEDADLSESESPAMSPSTRPDNSNETPVASPRSDKMTIDEDSVVNHGSESGVDLASSTKDEPMASPSGSVPSSPYSESLSLLASQPVNGSGGAPFSCEQCGLTFGGREELENHEVSHPVPNQSCKICFKQFANVYRLQRHMISHDESAGLRKFKCPDCEKAFKFKHHLKEHVRIHSGEKPFECTNCGKRFSHSGSYSSHMTSKKCLIMNLKLGRGRNVESKGTSSGSSPQRASHPQQSSLSKQQQQQQQQQQRNFLPDSTFPVHPLLSAKLAKTPISADNNLANNNNDLHNYPSTSPPFLPPGPVNFHPFFMTAAAAAGLPPHPYALNVTNFFNALPHNSPLRQLASLDKEDGVDGKGLSLVNGKSSVSSRSPSPQWSENKESLHEDGADDDMMDTKGVLNGENSSVIHSSQEDAAADLEEASKEICDNNLQRLLESVSATVNRQRLQNRHYKNGYNLDTECSSRSSPGLTRSPSLPLGMNGPSSPIDDEDNHELHNNNNNIKLEDEIDRKRKKKKNDIEGLAARLEYCQQNSDAEKVFNAFRASVRSDSDDGVVCNGARSEEDHASSQSENESGEHNDNNESQETVEEGRRARVRSLFSESQLAVLRHHYAIDPRPRREHLLALAQQLVLPLRVVQVWFQNSRARDRREGRPPQANVGFGSKHSSGSSGFPSAMSPLYNDYSTPRLGIPLPGWNIATSAMEPKELSHSSGNAEMPLDLSTKKSTPSNSPRPSTIASEPMSEDSEDGYALNDNQPLNLKASPNGSPSACHSTSTPTLLRLVSEDTSRNASSPNPINSTSRLARILSQPPASTSPIYTHRGNSNGSHNGGSAFDARTPSPAVSIGPIMTPMFSSLIPLPSSSPHEFNINGFNHSPLNLIAGSTNENGEQHPVFLGIAAPTKKRKVASSQSSKSNVAANNPNSNTTPTSNGQGEEQGQFSCDQCEKTFNKQSSLARHKYEHSGQRPYKCNTCEKAFKHKHHLTEHLRLHTGAKPFQCNKCGKRFSHSGSYSQHMNHRYAYCKPNPNNRN